MKRRSLLERKGIELGSYINAKTKMSKVEKKRLREAKAVYTHMTYSETVLEGEFPRAMFFVFFRKGEVATLDGDGEVTKITMFKVGETASLSNIEDYYYCKIHRQHNIVHYDATVSSFSADDVVLKWYGHGYLKRNFFGEHVDEEALARFVLPAK